MSPVAGGRAGADIAVGLFNDVGYVDARVYGCRLEVILDYPGGLLVVQDSEIVAVFKQMPVRAGSLRDVPV